jgi:hypothetical protein
MRLSWSSLIVARRVPITPRSRRYRHLRSLKPDNHWVVQGVIVWHRLDVFKHLALLSSQVYAHGAVAVVMRGGDRESGNLPYEVSSIWINPALHRRLIREDENEPDFIIPRTKVNPGITIRAGELSSARLDHWLYTEGHGCVLMMRHNLPSLVILHPDAADRIPEVTVKLVQLHRANKEKHRESLRPNDDNIDEQIARLVANADAIRPRF